jgi:hemoglobin
MLLRVNRAESRMSNPYQLLGGEDGVRALCTHFYAIMDTLPEASGIRAMHGESLEPVREKLFEYLSGWMGGPPLYQRRTGTVCLTRPHAPYAIGAAERDAWLLCMDRALDAIGAGADVKEMLRDPLFRVADMMVNRH